MSNIEEAMDSSRIIFAHIIDNNLGDCVCSPKNYFSEFKDFREMDFREIDADGDETLIVGGGGMLHPGVDDWIEAMSKKRMVYVWGVGLNYQGPFNTDSIAEKLQKCRLVGVRNKEFASKYGFKYVPGPTCLSQLLDLIPQRNHPIGLYEHFCHPMKIRCNRRINNKNDKSFSDAIKFISESNQIITNSYHGAYWASLLRVPYLIYELDSCRFDDIPSESIDICRELNREFFKVIKNDLGI